MALGLAHAPPSWHRPGPTALWFSLISGIVVGGIAIVQRIRRGGLVFALAFVLTALALAGMMGERYRMYDESLRNLYLGPPAAHNPEAMRQTLKHGSIVEEMMEDIREERRKVYEARRPFPVFLRFRIEPLGITEGPWPLVFWLGEVFIGGLVGAIVANRWHKWQLESTRPQR